MWLSQEQLSQLFNRDQTVISRHFRNVFKEGELDEKSNMQKMHITNSDKPIAFYNLDVIISVVYREQPSPPKTSSLMKQKMFVHHRALLPVPGILRHVW